jgi:magnesium transporter
MDKEVVAHIMADTNFHTLPVVDSDNELLGIITHDDVLDIMREESTEDFQKLAGAGADEGLFDPLSTSIKQRTPWLLVNLITAFIASFVVGIFDSNIAVLPLLAVFMPIIAGIGGNTGAQTLAVTVRSLALGEVGIFDMRNVCMRETAKGLINGIFIGALGAAIAFITTARIDFSLIVWIAMLINMGLGGFMGSFIPFTLKRMNLDPASGSSIFTTGVTDSGGFFIFLGLGSIFLV